MAKIREKERASTAELIEKVNTYLGDLSAKHEHKIGAIEGLSAEAGRCGPRRAGAQQYEDGLRAFACASGRAGERDLVASAEVLAAIRKLEPSQLVQLAIDFGLYERLRERPAG